MKLNAFRSAALFFVVACATRVVAAQSEPAILDMYVDCIEFEKLCDQLKPCENGAKCSPTYNDDGYKCDCPLGYGGKNCRIQLGEFAYFVPRFLLRIRGVVIIIFPRTPLKQLARRFTKLTASHLIRQCVEH